MQVLITFLAGVVTALVIRGVWRLVSGILAERHDQYLTMTDERRRMTIDAEGQRRT